jgi:acid ceramidase
MLCTSTVTAKGEHLRTLDWPLNEITDLAMRVEFYKGGLHLFTAVTFAGFVGVLTAMVPGAYSVSVNHRMAENVSITSMLMGLVTGRSMPVADAVRHCLEHKRTYNDAKNYLSAVRLLAPTYFTLCGSPGEGCVLARNKSTVAELREIGPNVPLLVQTNSDWKDYIAGNKSKNSFVSYERTSKVMKAHRAGDVYKAYATQPCRNEFTLYTTIMIPSQGILEWRLTNAKPFQKGEFWTTVRKRVASPLPKQVTRKRRASRTVR